MRTFILVGALLALVLTARSGEPQTASAIDACVAAGTGRVRIVGDAGSCKRKEHLLTWAVAGPPGTPGTPGQKGDPGTPGSNGPPPCTTVGRLTISGITGDGPGGSMVVLTYHVVLEATAGGPPNVTEFSVTKPLDKASPALAMQAIQGGIAATATLEIFAADHMTVATRYDLTNVAIASFTTGNPLTCASPDPTDTLSLQFTTIAVS